MKTKSRLFIPSAIFLTVLVFTALFASNVSATTYCADGKTMTSVEFSSAQAAGALSHTWTNQSGQAIAHVNNKTGCTAPLIVASYKMFLDKGDTNWLTTQQYIGDSGVVNINPNGNTDLTFPIASCRTQVDAYYQTAPHQLSNSSNGTLFYEFVAGDLCTTIPTLAVTCSSNPSSIQTGQSSTFTASPSGGTGTYAYTWTNACTGSNQSCTNTFNTAGTQTAAVTVTSGSQTQSASCSVAVTQTTQNLNISCYTTPNPVNANQSVSFISNASGGTGYYTYSWYGACTGNSQTCTSDILNTGTQSATVTVTSGSQSNSANCSVTINQSCTQNSQERCSGSNLYWFDSCGNQGNLVQYCPNGCSGSSCQNNYNTCTYHSYERCSGNNLYWFDSCGTQQDLVQYCPNGCSNNACQNYNNTGTLTVTKTVRDLTTGSGFATSTYADPSDTLMFMITLTNNSGQDVQNVFVRDTLPSDLIYNNQLVVACTGNNGNSSNCNNNNYNYSGNITSGINLNTISAGQTVTITYQVQVASAQNFAYGTTTLNNLVTTTASNTGYIPTATASVIVTRAGVLGASTVSTGLTNNFWVDSFFLPLMITLICLWMWRSGMFFGIEKWLDDKRKTRRGYKAEKELSHRIANIQKMGKV